MESQKKIRKEILHVINEYYESWLHQSNMNEEELLTYRSGEKFSIQVSLMVWIIQKRRQQ